ncbi:uncharacterized protein BBOV_IV007620 [Babesia bovis T2Bo]|uniref:Uncharacterized protein n=1 Tax=Babesia bovis TaxID=5865 RepID=A7ARE7_BABBO|nr:uncharacterized protein BBOV_IV007620 [Babesia bovis T2Bo]EDO07116.1 hypothetical protein BBOV_IV007620 [Babesia bovis T2Bo]|eukprot:XP_001610684.1 hypothetical protein [Babesia bovis T2Bo]
MKGTVLLSLLLTIGLSAKIWILSAEIQNNPEPNNQAYDVSQQLNNVAEQRRQDLVASKKAKDKITRESVDAYKNKKRRSKQSKKSSKKSKKNNAKRYQKLYKKGYKQNRATDSTVPGKNNQNNKVFRVKKTVEIVIDAPKTNKPKSVSEQYNKNITREAVTEQDIIEAPKTTSGPITNIAYPSSNKDERLSEPTTAIPLVDDVDRSRTPSNDITKGNDEPVMTKSLGETPTNISRTAAESKVTPYVDDAVTTNAQSSTRIETDSASNPRDDKQYRANTPADFSNKEIPSVNNNGALPPKLLNNGNISSPPNNAVPSVVPKTKVDDTTIYTDVSTKDSEEEASTKYPYESYDDDKTQSSVVEKENVLGNVSTIGNVDGYQGDSDSVSNETLNNLKAAAAEQSAFKPSIEAPMMGTELSNTTADLQPSDLKPDNFVNYTTVKPPSPGGDSLNYPSNIEASYGNEAIDKNDFATEEGVTEEDLRGGLNAQFLETETTIDDDTEDPSPEKTAPEIPKTEEESKDVDDENQVEVAATNVPEKSEEPDELEEGASPRGLRAKGKGGNKKPKGKKPSKAKNASKKAAKKPKKAAKNSKKQKKPKPKKGKGAKANSGKNAKKAKKDKKKSKKDAKESEKKDMDNSTLGSTAVMVEPKSDSKYTDTVGELNSQGDGVQPLVENPTNSTDVVTNEADKQGEATKDLKGDKADTTTNEMLIKDEPVTDSLTATTSDAIGVEGSEVQSTMEPMDIGEEGDEEMIADEDLVEELPEDEGLDDVAAEDMEETSNL